MTHLINDAEQCITYRYGMCVDVKCGAPSHMHTYIIGHYNPSVRIIELVTHTTYISGGTRNLLRGNRRRNSFCVLF